MSFTMSLVFQERSLRRVKVSLLITSLSVGRSFCPCVVSGRVEASRAVRGTTHRVA